MFNHKLWVFAFAFIAGCASETARKEDPLGYTGQGGKVFGFGTVEAAIRSLSSLPGAEVREKDGWIVVSIKEKRQVWSFPPSSHAAYPSAVKREVVTKNGSVVIETQVSCGSKKDVCDKLVMDFIDLNNKTKQQIQSGK